MTDLDKDYPDEQYVKAKVLAWIVVDNTNNKMVLAKDEVGWIIIGDQEARVVPGNKVAISGEILDAAIFTSLEAAIVACAKCQNARVTQLHLVQHKEIVP